MTKICLCKLLHVIDHSFPIAIRSTTNKLLSLLYSVTAGFPFGTPGAANIIRVIPAAGPTFWDATLQEREMQEGTNRKGG